MMTDFSFSVLWILAFSALQVISLSWGELKRLKENMSTIEALLEYAKDRQTNSEAPRKRLTELEDVVCDLRHEIECEVQLWSRGSAGWKLCRFFSSSNPLVFCYRIGHRVKKSREGIDKMAFPVLCYKYYIFPQPHVKKRGWVLEIIARIGKLYDKVTYFFFRASKAIGLEDRAKQIVYIVACIVGVCVDPFFLYIPFLSHTKMCLGMNRELWKVAVALRTVADFFTALILFNMSIDRPQLSRCMSSIKSILLLCVKYLALAPIPQILLSEMFILKALGGYVFWNSIVFCLYGARLVLIFQSCEQLKTRVSVRTLGRFNAPVYLFLYLIISHVIGAFWYYLSIQRQLSCWNYACKIDTGCIFHCAGTSTSTLNSKLYNQFCPINPPNAAVFDYGIFLDALQSGIVEEEGVRKKFLRCFFWGLRNLSSFASNLHTSTNDGETFFAIIISAVALILLTYVIGNIQRYSELESSRSEMIADKMKPIKELIRCLRVFHNLDNRTKKSIVEHIQETFENGYKSFNFERLHINRLRNEHKRKEPPKPNAAPKTDINRLRNEVPKTVLKDLRYLEEWVNNGQRDNRRKAKKWLSDNNIDHCRNNILFYLTCRLKDEDVNLESVISVIPDEYKWKTMKDLCFDTLKKVPGLQDIDEEWFKSISSKLEPVIYPKGREIFLQGRPLDFIIFITNGDATSYTSSPDAGGGVSVSTKSIKKGYFFGEELIQWKLDGIRESESAAIPSPRIPTCIADVISDTQVEAFVLTTKVLALSSDFPVKSGSADSATQGVASSSRLVEATPPPGEIEEMEEPLP